MTAASQLLKNIQWNDSGLVPAVAQDWRSGEVLMLAWMNEESLRLTIEEQRAIYWSRSRNRLWRKGEESGHVQNLKELLLDCDADTVLLKVEQIGGIACHTGRRHCFFQRLENDEWVNSLDVEKSPDEIYGQEDD